MPTRNINLTKHLDDFVEDTVASGRYANASEVIRDGLRLLEQRSLADAIKLRQLREASHAGFAAIERGEYIAMPASKVKRSIRAIGKRAAARARKPR